MTAYPTWDQKFHYLSAAETAIAQVRADVTADDTNVWQSIDVVIAQLHKLREAAGSEQMRQHTAMVARMESEEASRAARPAGPTPEIVQEARRLAEQGYPASARLLLREHTSMSIAAAAEYVESLTATSQAVTS